MSDVQRVLRSMRELRLMRKAGSVVWEAHQAALAAVKPGQPTQDIEDAVQKVFEKHEAIPLFLNFPGPTPFPARTCVSVNEEVVHGIPGERIMQPGDIVSIDTGCKIGGWCGDSAFTRPVGEISDTAQRLLDATSGALDLAIDLMGKESLWSAVAKEMEIFVKDAGFAVVEEFVGHAIGREMHEEPQVPNYFSERLLKEDIELRPGVVLAIEPMVNVGTKDVRCLADKWTQVTADGKLSAHFEHTIAITKDGAWVLTGPPTDDEK